MRFDLIKILASYYTFSDFFIFHGILLQENYLQGNINHGTSDIWKLNVIFINNNKMFISIQKLPSWKVVADK